MKVDVYSHSFMVSELSERQKLVLDQFSKGLIQYEWVVENGRKYRVAARVFASAFAERRYYRYHINLLEDFKNHLAYHQVLSREIEWTHHEIKLTEDFKTDYVIKDLPPPRDPQPAIIDHICNYGNNKIVTLQTGKGKASVLSAMIKIPGGWTTMGKIKLGDAVCTPDGGTAVVDGIFPQGKVPVYKVTFWDGRYTVVCGEHLWKCFYINTSPHRRWAVRDTMEMKRLISEPESHVYVPLTNGEDGPPANFPIPPYTLGAILTNVKYSKGRYDEVLKDAGLLDVVARDQTIPSEYLNTPNYRQRLDLLQGLMDADTSSMDSLSFSSTSFPLVKGVQYLVWSLGGTATIKDDGPTPDHSWRVYINFPKKMEGIGCYIGGLKLKVKSIEYCGEEEAQCISIDHPEHLYITDDFIVTHNTHLTKCAIARLGLRSVFFMKGSYIDRWIPDMENSFDFKKGELLVVRGSVALNSIMEMALEDDFTAKATFISINTFSEYLRDFERKGVSQLYPIEPGRFFEVMKFGIGVFDEGHQFPHQVMKLFTYMNVNKFVTLSATLDTMDPFMANMYNLMYPREQRFNAGYYDAFIQVRAINYQMRRPKAIRHTGWGGAYSHNTFEASMMSSKNKVELKNYLDLINYYVYERFVNVMEKGQKMLVFCGTIKFCTLLTKYLQKLYPKLKVARYVSKDKMSVMEDADIIVSTVLSAGTAVDIPNLRVSLMTTAIDSQQSNEQTLGRTRKLKDWPDVTPEFYYFVCTSIDKHVTYDKHKRAFFSGKVKSHGTEIAPISV